MTIQRILASYTLIISAALMPACIAEHDSSESTEDIGTYEAELVDGDAEQLRFCCECQTPKGCSVFGVKFNQGDKWWAGTKDECRGPAAGRVPLSWCNAEPEAEEAL